MSTIPQTPRQRRSGDPSVQTARELRVPVSPEEIRQLQSGPDLPVDGDSHETDQPASWQHKTIMVIAVVAPFLGFVAAIVLAWQFGMMSPLYLGLLLGGWLITGLGITVGFHRMLTHRSFDTHNWFRLVWAGLGSLAVEGPPLAWCAVHRKHHQHSDHEGDPHSPHLHGDGLWNACKGFVHAHFGWLFARSWNEESLGKYVPDLMSVPGMKTISRYYAWWVLASLLIPAVIAGLVTMSWTGAMLGFLWGGLARVFFTHHVTWSINSICHIFGSQDFQSGDDSRNNVIFGILSHGEGWHNNHHAFPTSARHGLKWWQFDTSWIVIRTMGALGLVWNIRTPSKKAMEAKRAA